MDSRLQKVAAPNKAINHRHFVAGQPKARFAHGCRLWRRWYDSHCQVHPH